MPFKRKHYIGMAGLHGCLPSTCSSYDTIASAAESLGDIHSSDSRDRHASAEWITNQLIRHHYVELDIHVHGNEYASIDVCHCDNPDDHNDN